jgi:hypothetical protein
VSIETTTSSISVLRLFVRRQEFLINVNGGVERSSISRYDLLDLAFSNRFWMVYDGRADGFALIHLCRFPSAQVTTASN